MTWDGFSPVGGSLAEYLDRADALILPRRRSETATPTPVNPAAGGYPPGVPLVEVQATGHVLEAAGMDCSGLIDEPSAANNGLGLQDGVIVDVGGGTTGIALLREGKVVRTADEPTAGTHFSLVVAGALYIPFEKAEALKITASEQLRLLPVVCPVMDRTCCRRLFRHAAASCYRHLPDREAASITPVGGTSAFQRMAEAVENYTGIPTRVPNHPMWVTPLGLALHDPAQ